MLACTQKPLSRLPQGEKLMPLETSIDLENQQNHQIEQKPTPCPLPAGEGQTDTTIAQANQGEVPRRFDLFITTPSNQQIALFSIL
jgi:hypothetical protein